MSESGADDVFDIFTANESMNRADPRPAEMLLGDLWMTGEVACLFAEPGCGKSLLAVQIAEAIARGKAIEPFEISAPAQKVVYLDLDLSTRHFRSRYSEEPDENGFEERVVHKFSENLIRVSPKNSGRLTAAQIEPLVIRTGAKVLIVDHLAHLQRYCLARETAAVMRELRRLAAVHSMSILVLVHSAAPAGLKGIRLRDMPASGVMASYADNIFAVGRSSLDPASRYIKHIKPGPAASVPLIGHLAWFRIERANAAFPAFVHKGFANENAMRAQDESSTAWTQICEIKRLSLRGGTIRSIAEDLKMSRSTVHRYLKMAPDEIPEPQPQPDADQRPLNRLYGVDGCIDRECLGCSTCNGRPGRNYFAVSGNVYGHDDCPDDCDLCGPRRYGPREVTKPRKLKILSDNFYENLRWWLSTGKKGPRPTYHGARRYGIEDAGWHPGSEEWTAEQLQRFKYERWGRYR